jgi:hypothetical protein
MKLTHSKIVLALAAALLAGGAAQAQSNGVPGPADYPAFSRFITDRNIFDPNRQPYYYSSNTRRTTPRIRTRSTSAPALTLVGTMSYQKGMFAFFNGNSDDLKKALRVADKIAGYTVMDISASRVKLETADKKKQFDMKVGDAMRQENGKWVFAGAGEISNEPSPTETPASPAGSDGSSESAAPATPSSATEPNEVLKRLMQLREKENQ